VAWSFDEALQLEQEDGSTVLKHRDCEYKYHCHFCNENSQAIIIMTQISSAKPGSICNG